MGLEVFDRRRYSMGSIIVRTATKQKGSVIQRQEALTFNQENESSSLSGPTNILVAKRCKRCNTAMYIHKTEAEHPIFTACEACIVDIKIDTVNSEETLIKAKLSTKSIRCSSCKTRHLLSSFEEVEDGVS